MDEKISKLIDLVEKALDCINEEMEHGCYTTPEMVPYDYEDEGDGYYDNQHKLVEEALSARIELRKYIETLKNEKRG